MHQKVSIEASKHLSRVQSRLESSQSQLFMVPSLPFIPPLLTLSLHIATTIEFRKVKKNESSRKIISIKYFIC